jgi:flagellar protein FliL
MSDEIVEVTETAPAPKKSKKKLIIIGAAGAVLLLGGGGGAAMMLGGGGDAAHAEASGEEGDHGEAEKESADHGKKEGGAEGEATYVDVPAMVVNLRSPDGGARFLKIHFMLVPGPKAEDLEAKLPVILDAYQPFLRELRPEDLAGSAAVYRIKEELLVRTAEVVGKGAVDDILIQDLIQQ